MRATILSAGMALGLGLGSAFGAGAANVVPEQAIKDADAGYFHRELAEIRPLLATDTKDPEVQFRYGQALLGINRSDEAIAALQTAITLEPNNGIYHRVLGEALEANAMQAPSFTHMFGIAKSIQTEFQSAVRLAPTDVQSHVDLATFYIMAPGIMGGSYDKAHAEEDALAKLDKVSELQVRAQEAGNRDDIATGETLLKQAIAMDKTSGSIVALGLLYADAKRYPDAFQAFRDARAKDANAYEAWYQMGRVAGIAKTNYEEGIESLKHYLAFENLPDTVPSMAWAHFRLGNLYEYQGHADLARAEYQSASNLQDNDKDLASKLKEAQSRLN